MIEWLQANWTDVALIITSIVTIASAIVKFTPTPKDDTILAKVKEFISRFIALNKKGAS